MNSVIKLMLVEDQKLMRVGLKSLFETKDGFFNVNILLLID